MEIFAGTKNGIHRVSAQQVTQVADCPSVRDLRVVGDGLFAASGDGVYKSQDGGQQWRRTGLSGLEVWQIRASSEGLIYAVTQPAGLYRSNDGGESWSAVEAFANYPGAEDWCVPIEPPLPGRARTLVIDKTDASRLWVGVEVGGVMVTSDGGESWQLIRPGENPDIHMLVAHPENPDELYVSTGYGREDGVAEMIEGNAGVFRTTDGGLSWRYAWQGVTPRYTRPLCIDPRPPHPLTVASAPSPFSAHTDPGGAGAYLFRSDDRGGSWQSLCDDEHSPSTANFHGLAPAADAPGSVLVGTDTGELWRVDSNARWEQQATGLSWVMSVLDTHLKI